MTLDVKINLPEDVTRDALAFVQRLLGPVAEVSDFLTDKVRFFRFRGAIKTVQLAEKMVRDAHLDTRQLPLKFLVPFLETCSLEEPDSELTERWATLLARAATDPNPAFVAYVNILSNIDPTEAKALSELWKGTKAHEVFRLENFGPQIAEIEEPDEVFAKNLGFTNLLREVKQIIEPSRVVYAWHEDDIPNTNEMSLVGDDDVVKLLHLQSLGLIRVSYGVFRDGAKRVYCISGCLTPLGYHFVDSCESPLS